MNHSHVIILIETSEKKKIGFYCSSSITHIGKYISDSNSFVFTVGNDILEKYPIIDSSNAFKVFPQQSEDLFVIGKNDILIKKKEKKDKCTCKQVSFDYHGKENVLIGRKGTFDINRISVIPMRSSKEIQYNLSLSPINQFDQLEIWTSLKIGQIVFDSLHDNWSSGTSVFNERIIGKKQLIFLIEDDNGEKFGYFEHTEIQNNVKSFVTTDNLSFHFNLQSQFGRLHESMKFGIINNNRGGYRLYPNEYFDLIRIGDIKLFKEDHKNESTCDEDNEGFDYYSLKSSLCGKSGFDHPIYPKRIVVIQMV